jgi:hypothetical protein
MAQVKAEQMAAALGGRVWTGDSGIVRVYWGYGKGECWLSVSQDGTLDMQLGRGATRSSVEAVLHAAGLVTGTVRETTYGGKLLDDVRLA